MATIPVFVSILFMLTTIITGWLFISAASNSMRVLLLVTAWTIFQSALSLAGFYQQWDAVPPRFLFSIAPGIIVAILLFLLKGGRRFIDSLDIKKITILHMVRLPVEITLYYVCLARLIPHSMTFEGNNFDILSGISAPVIYYLVFIIKKANWKVLLVWNFICLGLLVNVLVIAILSAKTPFQQSAFDQPNIGVAYFPIIFLPAVVVPIVLISQLAGIRKILKEKSMVK